MICTCCRTEGTALHTHGAQCQKHDLSPVVPLPTPLGEPGGEDCTGPTVKAAVLAAYRERGGVALELAIKAYGGDDEPPEYGEGWHGFP